MEDMVESIRLDDEGHISLNDLKSFGTEPLLALADALWKHFDENDALQSAMRQMVYERAQQLDDRIDRLIDERAERRRHPGNQIQGEV